MFHYEGGIAEFVEYLNRTEEVMHKPIYVDKTVEDVPRRGRLSVHDRRGGARPLLRQQRLQPRRRHAPVRLPRRPDAHAQRLRRPKQNLFKNDLQPIGEDFREGMTAIISVQVPEPQFESQTKIRLNNPEVEGIVSQRGAASTWPSILEENPKEAQQIMKKVILAAEAREAAAKAKKALKDRKSILISAAACPASSWTAPPATATSPSCSSSKAIRPAARPRAAATASTRRSCPCAARSSTSKRPASRSCSSNEEICSLISAVGIDIGNTEDIEPAALRQDHHPDRRRRGRPAHPHAASDLLLSADAASWSKTATSSSPARRSFKVTQKKQFRYVQTTEEMNARTAARAVSTARS